MMTTKIIPILDAPCSGKHRTIFTFPMLQIPGLQMFGKHTIHSAIPPLPKHYHTDCFEISFVAQGNITFSIGEKEYPLHGGDIFITQPNEVHSTNFLPISLGEIYWFQINVHGLTNFLFYTEEASNHLIYALKNLPCPKFTTSYSEMLSLLKQAFTLCYSDANRYEIAACFALFLQKIISNTGMQTPHQTADIAASLLYIANNLSQPLFLENLASLCHLSTSQYKQKFKKQIGVSPRNYINFKRTEAAKPLLIKGMSVTEVAMALAFESSNYFSVVFKRYNACSPSQYISNFTSTL